MKGDPKDFTHHLDILELPPDATFPEIRKAYLQLKTLYSTESIATLPVQDDISEAQKQEILNRIEQAYQALFHLFKNEGGGPEGETAAIRAGDRITGITAGIPTFTGPVLQAVREQLGVGLHDIALATKIQYRYLEKIETEAFDALPPEAYVRGMVVNYADFLSLDAKKVADDFMERYRLWKQGR